jgi:hypothetical protein
MSAAWGDLFSFYQPLIILNNAGKTSLFSATESPAARVFIFASD